MHIALILFFILIAPVIAGAYGAVYDMVVFTLAPEFFTQYRFAQFEISDKMTPIAGAAIIGFANSWKVGIPVGIILGALSYMHRNIQKTFRYMVISYSITIVSVVGFSAVGLLVMRNQLSENVFIGTDKALQGTVEIIVNTNNFAYAGALIGTALACGWQLYMLWKKREHNLPV